MKAKQIMKKTIATAMMLIMTISLMTTTAFARAEPCGLCNQGSMVGTETEDVNTKIDGPCINNTGLTDYKIVVYRTTYKVCNNCGARLVVNMTKIYESDWICPHRVVSENTLTLVPVNQSVTITENFPEMIKADITSAFSELNVKLGNQPVVMAEPCPSCFSGAAVTHYITEEYTSWLGTCIHGFPEGQDAVVQTVRLYVTECTSCNYRLVHSTEVIGTETKCFGHYS